MHFEICGHARRISVSAPDNFEWVVVGMLAPPQRICVIIVSRQLCRGDHNRPKCTIRLHLYKLILASKAGLCTVPIHAGAFYRAMHTAQSCTVHSAVLRLRVRLSVCNVGGL